MGDYEQNLAYVKSLGYDDTKARKILADRGIFDDGVNARNLARSAVQGATFNFGDEILGKLPEWMGGGKAAEDEMRARDKAFSSKHPYVNAAAQIAGGFAVPGIGGAGLLKGAGTIGGTIARGAVLGASTGVAASMGAQEGGLEDRLKHVPEAAAAGAVLGGGIPGVIGAGKAVLSPTVRAGSRLGKAFEESGGISGLLKRLSEFKAGGRGKEVVLGDLSPSLQQATDFAANNNEGAYRAVEGVVNPRQANATNRLLDDATARVGNPQADQVVSDLETGRQAWADGPTGYGGLRTNNPVVVPAMAENFNNLMQTPAVRGAWQQAREIGLIGPLPKSGSVSFDVMQGTLERLTTAKEAAFRNGANDLAQRLKAAQQALEEQMRQAVPGFGDIHAEYGVRKSLERAVRRGEEIFDEEDTRGLAGEIGQMTPLQINQLRQGLASKMLSRLRSAQTNRNVAQQLMDRSQAMNDKLKLIFGSRQHFEDFLQRTELEAQMAKLKKTIAGSQTHRRGAAEIDVPSMAAEAAISPEAAAFVAARNVLPRVLRGKTAGAMAPDLTTQGSDKIEELLRNFGKRSPLVPWWLGRSAPAAAGVGASNLFDQ